MRVRNRLVLPILCILAIPAAALAQQATPPPTVVVRFSSIDSLIDHVKFLVGLAGQKDAARQVEALIKTKIGDKGLEGVDARRPFGFYGRVGKEIDDVSGAILLPIADEAAFINLFQKLGVQAVKGAEGIYTIKTGGPFDGYLRFANKYAYISALNTSALGDKNLLDPAKILAGKPNSAFSLTVQLDQIPESAKQLVTAVVDQAMQDAQTKGNPGDTPAQKAVSAAALTSVTKLIASVIRDGKELRTDVDLDQKSGDLSASFAISAKPGSELATTVQGIAKEPSLFAGLRKKNAAFFGTGHLKLPDPVVKALGDLIDESRTMALGKMTDAGKKQQAEALLNAIGPTLKSGDLDGALVLTNKGNLLTLVTAFKVQKGNELEKTARDLVGALRKELPPALNDMIKLDVDSVGATKIHKIQVAATDEAGKTAEGMFGELSLYIAFTSDAVFLALGKDGVPAIKDAISAKATGASPLAYYEVDVVRLAFLIHPKEANSAKALFPSGQGGMVRVSVQGGTAFSVRLDTNVAVLRFLGQLREAAHGAN